MPRGGENVVEGGGGCWLLSGGKWGDLLVKEARMERNELRE